MREFVHNRERTNHVGELLRAITAPSQPFVPVAMALPYYTVDTLKRVLAASPLDADFPYVFAHLRVTFQSDKAQEEEFVESDANWNALVLQPDPDSNSERVVQDAIDALATMTPAQCDLPVSAFVHVDVDMVTQAHHAKIKDSKTKTWLRLVSALEWLDRARYNSDGVERQETKLIIRVLPILWASTHINPYHIRYLSHRLLQAQKTETVDELVIEKVWRQEVIPACTGKPRGEVTVWISDTMLLVTDAKTKVARSPMIKARWPGLKPEGVLDRMFTAPYLIASVGHGNCYVRKLRIPDALADVLFGCDVEKRVTFAMQHLRV